MPVWIRSELGVYTGKYGVRTDKVATRTTPETHTELTRISRKSTEATGYFYGPYTEVYVVYWDISGMLSDPLKEEQFYLVDDRMYEFKNYVYRQILSPCDPMPLV